MIPVQLNTCRVCTNKQVILHSIYPHFPVFIWPMKDKDKYVFNDIGIFICELCGHAQLQSMSEGFVKKMYSEHYLVLENSETSEKRLRLLAKNLGKTFCKKKVILDIGGGNNSCMSLADKTAEKWVVDINPSPSLRRSVDKLIMDSIENAKLPRNYFDIVFAFHVFEHFLNPLKVAKKIYCALGPNGRVCVEVPNFSQLNKSLPYYTIFHQHQSLFTMQTLDLLFSLSGFDKERMIMNDQALLYVYRKNKNQGLRVDTKFSKTPQKAVHVLQIELKKLSEKMKNLNLPSEKEKVGIYGAGGSTTLFFSHFPFLKRKVGKAFDRDKRKIGCLIPGTSIVVLPPSQISLSNLEVMLFLSKDLFDFKSKNLAMKCIDISALI